MIPRDIIDFQIELWIHDCVCPVHAGAMFINLVRASGYGCRN